MASEPTSPQRSLQRGKACISCRRRKMKCDGARPICDQCAKTLRPQDCEYTDNQGRTRTEVLEENVARLQSRIRELECPEEVTAPILLHEPTELALHHTNENPPQDIALYGSQTATLETAQGAALHSPGIGDLEVFLRTDAWRDEVEPPQDVSQTLLNIFLSHASQLGFALNIARFLDALNHPTNHPSHPPAALLHSIYLWAVRLSPAAFLAQHEQTYLTHALLSLPHTLSSPAPQQRVYALQAEMLLALYLLTSGRLLEGRYHAAAAVSIAVSSRLHKNPAGRESGTENLGLGIFHLALPGAADPAAPRDAAEEQEGIDVFWTAFVMDRCWSVALGSSAVLSEDSPATQIDTPWPRGADVHGQGNSARNQVHGRPVHAFLTNQALPQGGGDGASPLALRAKSAALFECATRLSGRFVRGQPISAAFRAEVDTLESAVSGFTGSLLPLDDVPSLSDHARRSFAVTYTLAHASTIQMYCVCAKTNTSSHERCLGAQRAIAAVLECLPLTDLPFLDPIIGVAWLAVLRVLGCVIAAFRARGDADELERAEREHAQILAALEDLGRTFPLMAFQAATVRELAQVPDVGQR